MKRIASLFAALAFAGLLCPANAFEGDYGAPVPPAYEEGGLATGLRTDVDYVRRQLENGMVSAYDDAPKAAPAVVPHGASCGCEDSCGCGGCGCAADCGCTGSCGCVADCGCGCQNCCCYCDPCCRGQGFTGGAEVMWLKPHSSSGTGLPSADLTINLPMMGVNQAIPLFDGTLDPAFDPSYRLWLGYQQCDGLGWRVRYWEFNHGTSGGVAVLGQPLMGVTTSHAWDAYTFDIEATDATRLGCNWDATLSAGFRYAEYRESRAVRITNINLGNPLTVSTNKSFSGIGPTSSVELRRQLSCNMGAFINARASVMMGDENSFVRATIPTVVDATLTFTQRNDVKFIYEFQGGVEFVQPFCGGSYFARGGVETQYWDTFGLDGTNLLDDASVGFGGFFLAAGINR